MSQQLCLSLISVRLTVYGISRYILLLVVGRIGYKSRVKSTRDVITTFYNNTMLIRFYELTVEEDAPLRMQ
jgi:hypothetical protein